MAYSEYIRNLLLFNGRVVFPGLGSLEMVKESARMKGNQIIPPGTELVFNHEASMDDGKLAESIASSGETDIEETRQQVLELVDQIMFRLNKGESFVFEGIGELSRNENNVFQFNKDPSFITDFDSFGLESFELEPQVEEDIPVTTKDEEPAETISTAPDEEKVEISEPKELHADEESSSHQPPLIMKKGRNPVWYIAGSVLAIVVGVIVVLKLTDFPSIRLSGIFGKEENKELISEPRLKSEGVSNDLEKILDSISKPENPLTVIDKTQSSLSKSSADNEVSVEYHIIAGSFRDTLNARELARELTLAGYPVIVLKQGNNLYRVSAKSFKDKDAGLQELNRFRAMTKNNAAWLLELDP